MYGYYLLPIIGQLYSQSIESVISKKADFILEVATGDCIYLFTDGLIDRFGGPEDNRMGSPKLKQELLGMHNLPMAEQKENLKTFFYNWKADQQQLDDICLMGLKF